jgi:hypothetical protein
MDVKNVRGFLVMALLIAILIYVAGVACVMADTQIRLGRIEHYIMHHVYSGGLKSSCGEIDHVWEKYKLSEPKGR